MAYFKSKQKYIPQPVPIDPPYEPPIPPTPPTPLSGSDDPVPRPTFTGSVSVTLYNNISDTNVLHKNISVVYSDTIELKNNCDFVNPVIGINTNTDISHINYMNIDGFYYYAHISKQKGHVYEIVGHMDGLMSADYSNCKGILSKSASKYNEYIQGNIPIASYEQIKTLQFPGGFSKNLKYLLVTVGGATNG